MVVPILAPLEDVSSHIKQPECIRRHRGNRSSTAAAIGVMPRVSFQPRRAVGERRLVRRLGPAGVFPLGFGRKPITAAVGSCVPSAGYSLPVARSEVLFFAEPIAEPHCVAPGDLGHRRIVNDAVSWMPPRPRPHFIGNSCVLGRFAGFTEPVLFCLGFVSGCLDEFSELAHRDLCCTHEPRLGQLNAMLRCSGGIGFRRNP